MCHYLLNSIFLLNNDVKFLFKRSEIWAVIGPPILCYSFLVLTESYSPPVKQCFTLTYSLHFIFYELFVSVQYLFLRCYTQFHLALSFVASTYRFKLLLDFYFTCYDGIIFITLFESLSPFNPNRPGLFQNHVAR